MGQEYRMTVRDLVKMQPSIDKLKKMQRKKLVNRVNDEDKKFVRVRLYLSDDEVETLFEGWKQDMDLWYRTTRQERRSVYGVDSQLYTGRSNIGEFL